MTNADRTIDFGPGSDSADRRPSRGGLKKQRGATQYSDEQLIAALQQVADRLPPGPIIRDHFEVHARISSTTLIRRFGGWREALIAADLGDRYSGRPVTTRMRKHPGRSLSDEEILTELRRIAAVTGRTCISKPDIQRHSGILGLRVVSQRFGTWAAAVEAAGLTLSPSAATWTMEQLLDNLEAVYQHHQRTPRAVDLNRPPSRISARTYQLRFSSWKAAKTALTARLRS